MIMNDGPIRNPTDIHHDAGEPRADPCLHAAIRLRWQAADLARSTSAGVVRATSELLDAIAAVSAADADSLPASVRRAAARLADQVHQAPLTPPASRPRPDRAAAASSPDALRRSHAADHASVDRLQLTPTETSGDSACADTIRPKSTTRTRPSTFDRLSHGEPEFVHQRKEVPR
jgi:hypothetical protein